MKSIYTETAPKVVGPYSQAIEANGTVFCSGQIAIDPKTNDLVPGGIIEQTKQVFANLEAVLKEAGSSLSNVVMANVYLSNMADYAVMNEIYGQYFSVEPRPARVTVGVLELPKKALVEISCVATK